MAWIEGSAAKFESCGVALARAYSKPIVSGFSIGCRFMTPQKRATALDSAG